MNSQPHSTAAEFSSSPSFSEDLGGIRVSAPKGVVSNDGSRPESKRGIRKPQPPLHGFCGFAIAAFALVFSLGGNRGCGAFHPFGENRVARPARGMARPQQATVVVPFLPAGGKPKGVTLSPLWSFLGNVCRSTSLQMADAAEVEAASSSRDDDALTEILSRCARGKRDASSPLVGSDEVVEVLRRLERGAEDVDLSTRSSAIDQESIDGTFELVFSSSVANLPLGIGAWLDGYLPNKETIVFDFETGTLRLSVETLPLLPSIDIVGRNLSWKADTQKLSYTVEGKDQASEWTILYADDVLVAGKSSVTGYNVLRRVV